jgi:hypothetical protein
MNELLLISIVLSAMVNIALFIYLFRSKKEAKKEDSFTACSETEPKRFEEALQREVHKVERYEDYSFCIATIELESYPNTIIEEVRDFFRKSDAVYLLYNKVYVLLPFLQLTSEFQHKVKVTLVQELNTKYPSNKVMNVNVQECSIYEMIKVEEVCK